MDANSVTFPTHPSATTSAGSSVQTLQRRQSVLSLSCHANAIEVCDFMYSASPSSWDSVSRFYEPSATYENPFVTATSRSMLSDIHSLAAHLSQIDVPRPLAVLHAIFGMKRDKLWIDPWLKAVRVWNEIGDICENESIGECHLQRMSVSRCPCAHDGPERLADCLVLDLRQYVSSTNVCVRWSQEDHS